MREFDALAGYPEPNQPRLVSKNLRTINHRIVSSERGFEFFDGERPFGYGGYKYDGRWIPIVTNMCQEYRLDDTSRVLQIGSEKGFLLYDFTIAAPGIEVIGTEPSAYARENTIDEVKPFIVDAPYTSLPFSSNNFDFVLALGPVYTLSLTDVVQCLREIQRVSRGKSFVTLASYTNENDYWLFKHWTLLGTTILRPDEWVEVMKYVGYTGDYKFTGPNTLKLSWAEDVDS